MNAITESLIIVDPYSTCLYLCPISYDKSVFKGDTICRSASVFDIVRCLRQKAYLTVEQERFSLKSARAHL